MRTPLSRIISVSFLAWLAILLVSSAMRHEPKTFSREEDIARASALLRNAHSLSGAYPSTEGKWVRIPEKILQDTPPGHNAFNTFLTSAPEWNGQPRNALIYRSDGKDFKLVSHGSPDCTDMHARNLAMIDPMRTAYAKRMIPGGWEVVFPDEKRVAPLRNPAIKQDSTIPDHLFGECWAYGVWTPGAVFW